MDNNNENKKGVVDKAAEVVQKVQKIKKSIKRIRWVLSFAPSLPVLGYGLLIFLCLVVAMAPVLYWGEIKAGIKNFITETTEAIAGGTEKTLNFLTFQGWETNEKRFFITLQDAYNEFSEHPNTEGELDVSLISATIHYGKFMPTVDDFEAAGEIDVNSSNYEEYDEDSSSSIIPVSQLRSFYKVANDKLGTMSDDNKMLSELVGYRVIMQCYQNPGGLETAEEIADWVADLGTTVLGYAKSSLLETLKTLNPINLIDEFVTMYSYTKEGENYFKQRYNELKYSINHSKVIDAIESSDFTVNCSEHEIALPTIYMFNNYDTYRRYLKEVHLPGVLSEDLRGRTESDKNEIIDRTIEEIFIMKETVDSLFDVQGVSFGFDRTPIYLLGGTESFDILFPAGTNYRVTSHFGERVLNGKPGFHYGIDFGGGLDGTPVLAAAPGIVVETGYHRSRGNYVEISHDLDGDGVIDYYTVYMHFQNNSIPVVKGQTVGYNQVIGLVGNTGNSFGAHLHFEIRNGSNKSALNPILYIDDFVPNNTLASSMNQIGTGTLVTRGEMTGYGPDCSGCSPLGNVACTVNGSSYSLYDSINYNDREYGNIRIFAADHNVFPCGTIIKVENHDKLDDFIGIVLDSGSAMRQATEENRVLLDLAFNSELDPDTFTSTQKHGQAALVYNSVNESINDRGLYYNVLRYGW